MQFLRIVLGNIWRWYFFLAGFIIFIPLYPVFLILLSQEKWYPKVFRLKKIWAKGILFFTGIRYKVEIQSEIDSNQAYVICPNHSSYLDIVLTNIAFPNYFHFMGKAELLKIPMFNIFFKKMNIPVKRDNNISAHRAFIRAAKDIDRGISIAIYPEATIPDNTPELGEFKNGAFKLAIAKQVPITPITFLDNWKILSEGKNRKYGGWPGTARIVIHSPVSTKGLTEENLEQLKTEVRKKIREALSH